MKFCLVLAFFLGLDRAAAGAQVSDGFYSGQRFHPLAIDGDQVAVRVHAGRDPRTTTTSAKDAADLAQLSLMLIPAGMLRADDKVVGVPVHFRGRQGAFGVLPSDILVRTNSKAALAIARRLRGFVSMEVLPFKKHLYRLMFRSPQEALKAANTLYTLRNVRYAHPNFIIPKTWRSSSPPQQEPLFSSQWHLENIGQFAGEPGADIHARGAWTLTTGNAAVVIAILDGGFQISHPDVAGGWWRNSGEVPDNGIDDDRNGFVDDVLGWNFLGKNNDLANGAAADHGTAVVGLAGARANGKGVTGVCPECTVLPIVVAFTPVDDAAAFYYARNAGAAVISNSWGYPVGTPPTDVVREAIKEVATTSRGGKGTAILFAMNNIDQDDCSGAEPDISSVDGAIAISASNDQDKKVPFSAWGKCLKLRAPSWDEGRKGITTTDMIGADGYNDGRHKEDLPDPDYTNSFTGTSAATPIAAGVFGLIFSANPALTRDQALAIALATADKVHPELAAYDRRTGFSLTYGYGRINAERAVKAAVQAKAR